MEEKQYPGYNERWTNSLVDHPLAGGPAVDVPVQPVEVKEEPQASAKETPPMPEPAPGGKNYITKKAALLLVVLAMIVTAGISIFATQALQEEPPAQLTAEEVQQLVDDAVAAALVNTNETIINSAGKSDVEFSVSQVATLAADAVVEISTEVPIQFYWLEEITEGAGSGVIISANGYIVTNNHVIEGATAIYVTLTDGSSYTATLVATDAKTDVAVLKISDENRSFPYAVVGSSADLGLGDPVVVIGNPLGSLGGSVTSGYISSLSREIVLDGETHNVMQTDAAINPGNSGGGMFNAQGELIGIVIAKSADIDVEGIGFALPIDDIKGVISDLMTVGYVRGRIALGIQMVNIDSDRAALSYRVSEQGVYILSIEEDSNAKNGGLQVGDRIVSIDGEDITDPQQVIDKVSGYENNEVMDITVKRGGKEVDLNIIMKEYIPAELKAEQSKI